MSLIIAEVGENHLGDMDRAKKMIDVSKDAGADYVKFQYYNADNCSDDDPEKEWFYKVQLDIDKIKLLYDYSRGRGINFMCTPWDKDKAKDLFDLGIKDMKIASFHIIDQEMLSLVNERADNVFLSVGMSSYEEIDQAVNILKNVDLYLLHCVSEYPLSEENVNLKVMDSIRDKYNCKVGYSDHTIGILACLAAAARGADVIEKHITLSKTDFGTDHVLSADPAELKVLGEYVKRIGLIIGTEEKCLTKEERMNKEFLRKRFSFNKQFKDKGLV